MCEYLTSCCLLAPVGQQTRKLQHSICSIFLVTAMEERPLHMSSLEGEQSLVINTSIPLKAFPVIMSPNFSVPCLCWHSISWEISSHSFYVTIHHNWNSRLSCVCKVCTEVSQKFKQLKVNHKFDLIHWPSLVSSSLNRNTYIQQYKDGNHISVYHSFFVCKYF